MNLIKPQFKDNVVNTFSLVSDLIITCMCFYFAITVKVVFLTFRILLNKVKYHSLSHLFIKSNGFKKLPEWRIGQVYTWICQLKLNYIDCNLKSIVLTVNRELN